MIIMDIFVRNDTISKNSKTLLEDLQSANKTFINTSFLEC